MAKDIPAVPNPGDVATVANWAQKVIDTLTAALYSGDVIKAVIKTGTDNGIVSMNSGDTVGLTMQDFCFFPNFYGNYRVMLGQIRTDAGGTTQVGRIEAYCEQVSDSTYFGYNYRYITASGPPEIWVGLDKNDFLMAVVAGDDPQKGNPPIEHPRITKWFTLKPTKEEFETLKLECTSNVAQALISEGRIKGKHLLFREREWIVEPKEI